MSHEILKHVPVPARWEYPWLDLEHKDCVIVENPKDWKRYRNSAYYFNSKLVGESGSPRLTSEIRDGKLHIWRVK